MNRGQMKTQTAIFAEDKDQTRYSGMYEDALDRASQQFALDTKALWKDTSWSHSADDADEDLPTDFMWEEWVTYDGKELTPKSRYELNSEYPDTDWTTLSGTPIFYIIDPEEAVKEIVLVPIPKEAKTLVMRYFPMPAAMSSDTDVPLNSSALMVQFHLAICAFAAWLLKMGESNTPQGDAKKADLLSYYNHGTELAISTFKNTASAPMRIKSGRIWR
jgi:hypothetical protein